MAKTKKKEELEPMPKLAYRDSAAPPPPAKDSPWGPFPISPELAKYEELSKKR